MNLTTSDIADIVLSLQSRSTLWSDHARKDQSLELKRYAHQMAEHYTKLARTLQDLPTGSTLTITRK